MCSPLLLLLLLLSGDFFFLIELDPLDGKRRSGGFLKKPGCFGRLGGSGYWRGSACICPRAEEQHAVITSGISPWPSFKKLSALASSPVTRGSSLGGEHDCTSTAATQRLAAASPPALPLPGPCGASLWLATATTVLSQLVVSGSSEGPSALPTVITMTSKKPRV